MSLASVLHTALSGMSAATMTVRVAGNNLANSRTTGFKAGRATFATQSPATLHTGSAPSGANGGGNPVQIGTGVRTVGVATDFSQGSIALSSSPLHLALQGDGFFIVKDSSGGQAYTRAGEFQLNAEGEIVTAAGHRVLGFGVDDQFQADGSALTALSIPIGATTTSANGTAATLTDFSIREDGRIEGWYSDGVARDLGQVRVARFPNPSGLEAGGDGVLWAGANSGLAVESNPGSGAAASIAAGAIKLSNTDVGQNLIDLVLASQQFVASANVFRTADYLLDELIHLNRPGR